MIRRFVRNFDFALVLAVLLLVALGVLMISSATANSPGLEELPFRQAIYGAVGFVLLGLGAAIDYRSLTALRWPLYGATLLLLGVIFAIGQVSHGGQRWIDVGIVRVQPSELAKLVFVLVLASFLASRGEAVRGAATVVLSLVLLAVPAGLIYLQPDLGTALVLVFVWGVMLFAAGVRLVYLGALAGGVLAALPLVWPRLEGYMQRRLVAFLNPASDPAASYNVRQALISIGSGGLFGKGFRHGTQSQLHFLRIRHTDFIFSVIGEELGLAGCVLVIGLLGFVMWRILRAAELARDAQGRLIAVGLAAILFFQTVVNIGVNVGLMPVTGIPLPFISSGGSSLVTFLFGIGLVESVLLRRRKIDF
ncbi:MAG: rod shape-determining protein RodA [Anaerolineae bacterium]|nr:rod shape-determining protein RodA [Anaerolineae bacterium]